MSKEGEKSKKKPGKKPRRGKSKRSAVRGERPTNVVALYAPHHSTAIPRED